MHPTNASRRAVVAALAASLLLSPLAGAANAPAAPAASAPAAAPGAAPAPAAPAPANMGGDLPEELYFENLDVSIVNIDVYVTDKAGKRVTGLRKEDFLIEENKKPVAITNFFAVENDVAVVGGVPIEPEAPGLPKRIDVPEDQRLRLIVYIDNFNIRPFNRNRVLKSMRLWLDQNVDREDQVMLASYNRSLKIRRGFTNDPEAINAGLLEIEKETGFGVNADSERRDIIEAIEESESENDILPRVRTYTESLMNDLEFSVRAMKELVGSLAGLPGRKAILYVSDGIPMRPGEDLFYAVQNKYQGSTANLDAMTYDFSRRFTELTALANANRVSFYTLDAAGLRVSSSVSAENRDLPLFPMMDSMNTQNLQEPLRFVAEETGGLAIMNSNDPAGQLNKVTDDFENYYSLGYSPSHRSDGRYYKVAVTLKNKARGVEVRHREGYRDKSVESRMSDGTLASLYFGYSHNPMGFTFAPKDMTLRDDGNYLVTFDVQIPLASIEFLPGESVHQARARLFISAMDRDGGMSEVQELPIAISVPVADLETAKKQNYTYEVQLLMRAGEQKLAIGLRDDIAATTAFLSKSIRVGR